MLTAPAAAPLSPALEIRLLRTLTTIRTAETSLVVLPALFVGLCIFLKGFTPALAVWMAVCIGMSACMAWARRALLADEARMNPDAFVKRWRRITHTIAFTFGLVWVVPLLIGPPLRDAAAAIFYVMLCGVTAGTAVYVCSVIRAYGFFLLGMWLVATVELYWVFPSLWYLLAPACLLFCWNTWQHANSMHRFVVEHAELEERSQQLAQGFQQAHEAALVALEEKNRFLSIASHDLRQPLHAMSLLVEAVRMRNQDTGVAPLLDDLRSNMTSMSQMFNALLDLSRMEAGGMSPYPEPVALSEVMRDIERIFRPQAVARGLGLRLHLPRREVWVHADPTLLRQVLFNLVHNALRYTEHGGVLLAVRRAGAGGYRLEVWDTGAGINSEDGSRVFTHYYRGQQAWRADETGLGLGLAVVARCAKLMDNAPHGFHSRLGRGSLFWMSLPAATKPAHGWPAAMGRVVPTAPALRGRCLILDDDLPIRSASQLLLEGWGLETRGAGQASEAFALLRAGFSPQVILCDQRLRSGESGAEVLQSLLEACPGASGAIVSGEFDSLALRAAEAEGFVVLRKPVDPGQLHVLLSTWLDTVGAPGGPALAQAAADSRRVS